MIVLLGIVAAVVVPCIADRYSRRYSDRYNRWNWR